MTPLMLGQSRTLSRALAVAAALASLAPGVPRAHAISSRTFLAPAGAAAFDNFGIAVAAAGDVNGDGYDDVIVGAPGNDAGGASAGQAYVYYGGAVADAVADLTLTGAAASDLFGSSVSGAGDVNGDGYDDVIVGAYGNDAGGANAGRAYVYYGGPGADAVADLTLTGAAAGDNFGISVSAAGDVNGDGYDDVIVGASLNDAGGANAGRAYVYHGGPGADAVADLTMTGAVAGDAFGGSVAGAGDVNGDGYADVIVGAPFNDAGGTNAGRAYVYHGGPGADPVADLTLTGAAASDNFGFSVSGAGDVNGDGYADLIVGAYANDAGGANAGQASVFHGGPGADAVADLTLTGAVAGDFFGYAVSGAGDVNGDGYADVIVGAYLNDAAGLDAGRAYVYHGGPGADSVADVTLTGVGVGDYFGSAVSGAGDVNGDGYDDVIAGAYLNDAAGADAGRATVTAIHPYQVLAPNGGEQWVAGRPATVRWRGHDVADVAISFDGGANWSVRAAGVGGSEDNEISFTAPSTVTAFAKVRLSYSGQAASRATSDESDGVFSIVHPARPPAAALRVALAPAGAAAGDFFGSSVSGAGDLNGDGYDDVIVGAHLNDAGGGAAGRAYVYYGGPGADAVADLTLTGAAAGDQFGISVSGAGDVNGDGHDDVIVGAPMNDAGGAEAGRAYVFHGGPGVDAVADLTLTGEAAADFFGISVSGGGDVNGDGYADVIVGAHGNDGGGAGAGRAYVYFGGPGADAMADLTLTGEAAGDSFGLSVSGAGDMNGDGYDDAIVGADRNDAAGTSAGRAYVYFGGPGPDTAADLTLTGAAPGDRFGISVSGAGDVNGDGYADVIVAGYLNDSGGVDAGRAYVYHGGPGADAVADLALTGAAAGDRFGVSVSGAGDVNGDGYADVIVGADMNDAGGTNAGRAYVYYGGPGADAVADRTLTGETASDSFGISVSGAGDLNRDGCSDVIVGAYLNDATGSSAGRAYLHDFNRYFVMSPNDDEVWNVGAGQSVTWLGAERADLWLSTDAGRTYDLLRHDVGGGESNTVSLLVPHAPTRFARVRVTPVDPFVSGFDESDSLFTIEASVALLNLKAEPLAGGGVLLSWSTNPGPENLRGYRVERSAGGSPWSTVAPLVRETEYRDEQGAPGSKYRLFAVNGLGQEILLGEAGSGPIAALSAWPLPYRGGDLTVTFLTAGGLGGAEAPAEVAVFDAGGRLIRRIAAGDYPAGAWTATWDGRDEGGRMTASGIYFLRAASGGRSTGMKLVVTR